MVIDSKAVADAVKRKCDGDRIQQVREAAQAYASSGSTDQFAVEHGFVMACRLLNPHMKGTPVVYCKVVRGSLSHFFAWAGLSEAEVVAKIEAIVDKKNVPMPRRTAERLVRHHIRKEAEAHILRSGWKAYIREHLTPAKIRRWDYERANSRRKKLVNAASSLTDEQLEAVWNDAMNLLDVEEVQSA